jgi:hypothetical protein
MLSGVLLHVIEPSGPIDLAAHGRTDPGNMG